MDGNSERMAALYLSDQNDPTRLTWREVKQSYGSWSNFMVSFGLKPWNQDDLEEALAISRSMKQQQGGGGGY